MNVSYKWLKEYVDFDLTPQETADALTSCGLEVDALEEVQSVKGGLKGLYVGKEPRTAVCSRRGGNTRQRHLQSQLDNDKHHIGTAHTRQLRIDL